METRKETVEEYLARGGQIQRLPDCPDDSNHRTYPSNRFSHCVDWGTVMDTFYHGRGV